MQNRELSFHSRGGTEVNKNQDQNFLPPLRRRKVFSPFRARAIGIIRKGKKKKQSLLPSQANFETKAAISIDAIFPSLTTLLQGFFFLAFPSFDFNNKDLSSSAQQYVIAAAKAGRMSRGSLTQAMSGHTNGSARFLFSRSSSLLSNHP